MMRWRGWCPDTFRFCGSPGAFQIVSAARPRAGGNRNHGLTRGLERKAPVSAGAAGHWKRGVLPEPAVHAVQPEALQHLEVPGEWARRPPTSRRSRFARRITGSIRIHTIGWASRGFPRTWACPARTRAGLAKSILAARRVPIQRCSSAGGGGRRLFKRASIFCGAVRQFFGT
jgi:hypothetical protein